MSEIIIYKRRIPVPTLSGERFQKLRERIRAHHQFIKEGGQHAKTRWDKFVKRQSKPLTFEEQFHELSELVHDYESMFRSLQAHKASYDRFFLELTNEVRLVVSEKCDAFLQLEEKRLDIEQEAIAEDDGMLLDLTTRQQEQLLQSVRLLGQAALLLLKKIHLFKTSLERLADDQELQNQVLDKIVKRLQRYYKAYQLQKEIDLLEQQVAEMAQVALNFEEFMRDYLGPFQELIEQVTKIDTKLFGAVEEIKQISHIIVNSENRTHLLEGSEELNEQVLEFLIQSHLKRDRMAEILEKTPLEDMSLELPDVKFQEETSAHNSIRNALENIQTLLDIRLPQQLNIPRPELSQRDIPHVFVSGHEVKFEVITVDVHGQEIERKPGKAHQQVEDLGGGVFLEMIYIPDGRFLMGAPRTEKSSEDRERPQHEVMLAPFYMSKYPITQEQWKALMRHNPSSHRKAKRPVENVPWHTAIKFCKRLSAKTGRNYRLPSEAEWEYACRAGTTTPFHFGHTLTTDLANYNGEFLYAAELQGIFRQKTMSVGSFPPNSFGLYDMHGNVWEWCADFWHDSYYNAPVDGGIWDSEVDTSCRLLRGGAWDSEPIYCRSAHRSSYLDHSLKNVGFRIVMASSSWTKIY